MADLKRLYRETVGAKYFRTRPLEAVRYAASKVTFHRASATTAEELLDSLGFDGAACVSGLAAWDDVMLDMGRRAKERNADQGSLQPVGARLLYGLVRGLQPEVVVETGVAAGMSTSYLSAALLDNGQGRLISIDLPPAGRLSHDDGSAYDWDSQGGVGWAIPDVIRERMEGRHELVLEDVRTALPKVLASVDRLDMFVHDDLHTPPHMRWQFDLVWPKLTDGGMLVADDLNQSWLDFARAQGLGAAGRQNLARVGALRKPAA